MLTDAQTDNLIDYWTNCKTATRNLSGDWLRCYDLLSLLEITEITEITVIIFILTSRTGVLFEWS